MGPFVDLHCHALCGVDDGARSTEEMRAIVDVAYADGTRVLCLTPHFHPGYWGDNRAESQKAFDSLVDYVRRTKPDMRLILANELHYASSCPSWLAQGFCRAVCGRYTLVDFSASASRSTIMDGMRKLLNAGYVPILAHPERYEKLSRNLAELKEMHENGVLLQMDAQSPLGGFGLGVKMRANAMLRKGLVDFVGSDAHNLKSRPPQLSQAFLYVQKKYGALYAQAIFYDNAIQLLGLVGEEKK